MRRPAPEGLDLQAIRDRLARARGREYWRSLEEVAGTEAFLDHLKREFPAGADAFTDPAGRRNFLKLMAASIAFSGLTACTRQPVETIVPFVDEPERLVPGVPLFFATALPFRGFGLGVLVESHMARPTKIEGNEKHPASRGATDAFAQASVLTLYDPDRSQAVRRAGQISAWNAFLDEMGTALADQRLRGGAGIRILTETITSPTLAAQIGALLERFPAARWHQYESASRDTVRAGARLAFGRDLEVRYRFDRADVILALDADFLSAEPGSVRYAREFIDRRRVRAGGSTTMNRLYAVEGTPTITGAMADHRLPLGPSRIEAFARALAAALTIPGANAAESSFTDGERRWIAALARDLREHRGRGLVLAGDQQPPATHVLAHAVNAALGNAGRTVEYTEPVEARPVDQMASLRDLAADMEAGRVEILVVLGGNPVYDAPSDVDFATLLARVPLRVRLGLYEDETSELCHWHVPQTHPLEAWGDVRAYDGTVTIQQPLIAPLYDGHSPHEVLAIFTGSKQRTAHDIVRAHWRTRSKDVADFEMFWRTALHDGVVEGTALPALSASMRADLSGVLAGTVPAGPGSGGGSGSGGEEVALEIVFRPDPTIWDGRHANNGWLQELPKPLTKITWENAALLSPATAGRLGLASGDVVSLAIGGRSLEAPVFILPGHAPGAVTLHLGYGRARAGRVGTGAGVNASLLRASRAPGFEGGLALRRTGRVHPLATTQEHHSMEGRHLVRAATLGEFLEHPDFAREMEHAPDPDRTLHPPFGYESPSWGMAIDLNACIGCNACVVACQAENNIPIVGKDQVMRGREMHWIRIDRYYAGGPDDPEAFHQPVLCMHCEKAPCEPVCPVGATTHSTDGLNQMTYNRCVGTRYCSNNCPYKVRRFNFMQYSDLETPSRRLGYNPDVTVRTRGVMEKCTYCVQRISGARITARNENRDLRDGDVATACEAACPTRAIVFGDVMDPDSRVARLKAQPLNYGILEELNTRPRTTYLARLSNPNPDLEGDA